ncbi:MAG: HDOD domain-containing protein [Pseudomonadota bacterium]
MDDQRKTMKEWLAFLKTANVPVLGETARALARLREDDSLLDPRHIAPVVTRDPLMTAKLLHYMQTHKHLSQRYELIDVKQMLLMLGIETFYREVPATLIVEDVLRENPEALERFLQVVQRARHAAYYAYDWAIELRQPHPEEAQIAALLTHVSELLLLCFNPGPMLEIRRQMLSNPALRSDRVQSHVLGFAGREIQRELVTDWHLPELLVNLLDPAHAQAERVRHVRLAANLARHAANGWQDAGLPQDYQEIANLLHTEPRRVKGMIHGKPLPEKW